MDRKIYNTDHDSFRTVARTFVERTVKDHVAAWDTAHAIPESVWTAAGKQGVIGLPAPCAYGGGGIEDYRFRAVLAEELARVGAGSVAAAFAVQDDLAIPYISDLGTDEQRSRWLPGMTAGRTVGAVAMTEPGAGSDLRGIRTSGTRVVGGWEVSGSKTFISNGIRADVVVTVVRTGSDRGSDAFSLMVLERGMEGFSRGRRLDKLGLHAQDTAELVFEKVFVPDANVLGEVGAGLRELMRHLPLERLSIAAQATSSASAVLTDTIAYTMNREAFGGPISDLQHIRFTLAELTTEVEVATSFVDRAMLAYADGQLTAVDAAKAKWWATDMQGRVIDRCLQLFGGYGYMMEYPVARAYADARVQRIFGGTNEIMKEIIGRDVTARR